MSLAFPPTVFIIAGPNGAGKTTFARRFLPIVKKCETFVNADLIAAGLSPFRPETAAMAAGRLMLRELDRLTHAGETFGFETTLSGRTYLRAIRAWKARGYRIEIYFLRLESAEQAVKRVALRVMQGGHHVPDEVVQRRFAAGWANFLELYEPLADYWEVYDNTEGSPVLLDRKGHE